MRIYHLSGIVTKSFSSKDPRFFQIKIIFINKYSAIPMRNATTHYGRPEKAVPQKEFSPVRR